MSESIQTPGKTSPDTRRGYEDWCKSCHKWNDSICPDEDLNRFRIGLNRFRESRRV